MQCRKKMIQKSRQILRDKMAIDEIFCWHPANNSMRGTPITNVDINLKTRFRNAERLAFKRVRDYAKRIGARVINYTNWSGANPDFMNGDDSITPKYYSIQAVLCR